MWEMGEQGVAEGKRLLEARWIGELRMSEYRVRIGARASPPAQDRRSSLRIFRGFCVSLCGGFCARFSPFSRLLLPSRGRARCRCHLQLQYIIEGGKLQ